MGISGLLAFLRKKCSNKIKSAHLGNLKKGGVAIDIRNFIHIFSYGGREGTVFQQIVWMVVDLVYYGYKPLFIFDGKASNLKDDEHERRAQIKQISKDKKQKLESDVNQLKQEHEEEAYLAESIKVPSSTLIEDDLEDYDEEKLNLAFDLKRKMDKIEQYKKANYHVNDELLEKIKTLLTLMNVIWIEVEEEADPICALLNRNGIVEHVISEDSDLFPHGANSLLTGFSWKNSRNTKMMHYDFVEIRKKLKMDYEKVIEWCSLPKNDYNQNVRIKGLGIAKAYDKIIQFNTIANFVKESPFLKEDEKKAYDEIIRCSKMFSKYHSPDFKLEESLQKKIDTFKTWKPDFNWVVIKDFFAQNKIIDMFSNSWDKSSPKKSTNISANQLNVDNFS